METIRPDRTAPTKNTIDRPGEPDRQSLHPARERTAIYRLDDEVDVISLDGELHDPETIA
jgi:hypothetical protein